jgi:hypothetical protein
MNGPCWRGETSCHCWIRFKAEETRKEIHSQMDAVMAKVADRSLSRDAAEAVRKNGGVPEKPKRSLPVVPSEPPRTVENVIIRGNTFTNETRDAVKFTSLSPMPPVDERERQRIEKLIAWLQQPISMSGKVLP